MNFVLTFYECRRLGSCGGDLQIDESSFPALSKPRQETGLDREMISGRVGNRFGMWPNRLL